MPAHSSCVIDRRFLTARRWVIEDAEKQLREALEVRPCAWFLYLFTSKAFGCDELSPFFQTRCCCLRFPCVLDVVVARFVRGRSHYSNAAPRLRTSEEGTLNDRIKPRFHMYSPENGILVLQAASVCCHRHHVTVHYHARPHCVLSLRDLSLSTH